MAIQAEKRRRGMFRHFRLIFQRAINTLPLDVGPIYQTHEKMNSGGVAQPVSERRFALKDLLQRISYFAVERFLAQEFVSVAPKTGNLFARDAAAYAALAARDKHTGAKPNSRATLSDLIARYPTLDSKLPADWEATLPNKDVIPPFQLDPAMMQHLEFARFLLQRGIYNEGFDAAELPPQYRNPNDYPIGDDKK
jgi:hypothetical protein